jgi:hypothetical protein
MSVSDRAFPLACGVTLAALAGLAALALVLWVSTPSPARTLYPGQYAQVDPAQRQWFQSQEVPAGAAKGSSCCSEADGATAEEEIRGDHYWVRFTYKRWNSTTKMYDDADADWMQVPDDAILPTNHNGSPIVWWWIVGGDLKIRCYARGSGI